jgi:hypothetical protein
MVANPARTLGALSSVQAKVIFGIGRRHAEYFVKCIGYRDTGAVKRDSHQDPA